MVSAAGNGNGSCELHPSYTESAVPPLAPRIRQHHDFTPEGPPVLPVMLLAALSPTADPAPRAVEIVGHRGASFDAPENTVASVKLAWAQKADAAEFDVYLSKDGQIVVIHDADTKRVAGVEKKVVAQTLAELRQLDAGKWKGAAFAGEKIPTLAEVLATVPAGKRVFIEVKCGPEIVPELDRVLRASKLKPEQTAVISFSAPVVAAVRKARPDLKAYWIVSLNAKKGATPPTAEQLIAKAKEIGADGLDLSAPPTLDRVFADKVRAAKLGLFVWTVNDVATAKRMVEIGVDGITTDRPGWLREQLGK
jgi:glycerophosphoryl diester phosphodiesterase